MSTDLLNSIATNSIEKGVQNLGEWLSELPGAAIIAAVNKPRRFRLEYRKCLAELEQDADSKF